MEGCCNPPLGGGDRGARANHSADRPAPDDLVRGKATLAQIRNLEGIYRTVDKTAGAIELLTQEPHSVLSGVALPLGETNVPRRRAILRAGPWPASPTATPQGPDRSEGPRRRPGWRGGTGEGRGLRRCRCLTQVFVEFGRELENELTSSRRRRDRSRDGSSRRVRSLLDRPARSSDGQNFSSLFWIAETFTSLGESTSDDPSRATKFFAQAGDAYQKIVDKTQSDSAFAQPISCSTRGCGW